MSRELRRVHKDWQHPKKDGVYIPLHGGSWSAAARRWDADKAKWDAGERPDYAGPNEALMSYEGWAGVRPFADEYMPDWPMVERTHFQLYEAVSEGTPISPVMESLEALAQWCLDDGEDVSGGGFLSGLESDLLERERAEAES